MSWSIVLRRLRWCSAVSCVIGPLPFGQVFAVEKEIPGKVRIAIYADKGITDEALPELRKCLTPNDWFEIGTITAAQIREGALQDYDVLIQPGGSASEQGTTLGPEGRERVREYVADGGGFIGICAGAYLASVQYPWSIGVLNAHVLDGAHWARGEGNVQLQISSSGQAAFQSDKPTCTIHYQNGPLLGPGHKKGIPPFEVLAAYDSELTENGAPKGVMKGTAAIARGNFGKGRVVCFSPHPEKTSGREPLLHAAVRWAADADH
jgi:glutamine amidotransferase-like uncharacterized protein